MEHLLRAGSNLLNATVHLRSSRQLCGSPWKNLTDVRHLPQLKLMITIQTTFACYDIPFVQEATCTPASIHCWQLVCTLAERDVPAQLMLPVAPAGLLLPLWALSWVLWTCLCLGKVGGFRNTWKGDVAQHHSSHSGRGCFLLPGFVLWCGSSQGLLPMVGCLCAAKNLP